MSNHPVFTSLLSIRGGEKNLLSRSCLGTQHVLQRQAQSPPAGDHGTGQRTTQVSNQSLDAWPQTHLPIQSEMEKPWVLWGFFCSFIQEKLIGHQREVRHCSRSWGFAHGQRQQKYSSSGSLTFGRERTTLKECSNVEEKRGWKASQDAGWVAAAD